MNISNLKFPYPVLGKIGDINKGWKYWIQAECSDEFIKYTIEIENEFEDICKLIEEGKASYAFEIRCEKTFYRKVELSNNPTFDFYISRREIRDSIDITGYIIATEDQPMYESDDFKDFYKENLKFLPSLQKGEILGIAGTHHEPIGINYDSLGDDAFIEWKKGGEDCEYEYVNYNRQNIQVVLPPKIFAKLHRLKNTVKFSAIFQSSLIYNALYVALPHIDDPDVSEKQWAQIIKMALKDAKFKDYDVKNDLPKVLQILLQDPYSKMLDSLEQINTED